MASATPLVEWGWTFERSQHWVRSHRAAAALILGVLDFGLVLFVTRLTSYTEIDWSTYMQQVGIFLDGERIYDNISGDTGPCVYPANFLYIYSLLYNLTDSGRNIASAQIIFCALHAANVTVVARAYLEDFDLPIGVLALLPLSRRVASIYALRLFNDGVEALLANLAVLQFVRKRYFSGCTLLSLAVGVKMNGLLYAPAAGVLMIAELGIARTFANVAWCLAIQVLLAVPFVTSSWESYVRQAFDLGRVFLHKWSVNFAFLPEATFQGRPLAMALLVLHFGVLIIFTHNVWGREFGGLLGLLGLPSAQRDARLRSGTAVLAPAFSLCALLTCNLIGVAFARTIHYQFYAWYFHALPYLLWQTALPNTVRLIILLAVEAVYNIYPPRALPSAMLHVCHFTLLAAIYHRNTSLAAGTDGKEKAS